MRTHRTLWSVALLAAEGALPAAAGAQPRVVIDAARVTGPVRREVLGADLEYISTDVPAVRAMAAAMPLLRFPGGDADSVFQWDRPLVPACGRDGVSWPAAAAIAAAGGAGLFIETNILRSTPDNAAAWVADALARGLRVPWVGIGNEVWGDWDAGHRTALQYAADVRAHAAAIRARAPDAKIVLEIGTSHEDRWNREALRRTADLIDAVDYHYYPNHQPWAEAHPIEVIAGADGVGPLVDRLRAMIRDEAPKRADRIEVVFGEWDGAADPPPVAERASLVTPRAYASWSMADGVFYGAAIGEMLTHGVAAAMMYEVQGYRFGAIAGSWCIAADPAIRRPKALVHQLWREHVGDALVATTATAMPTFHVAGPTQWDGFAGDAPVVRAYASLADRGDSLRIMVVNRGAAGVVPAVAIELHGFDPEPSARVFEVGNGALSDANENVLGPVDAVRIRSRALVISGASFVFATQPYTVSAIELRRRGVAACASDAGTGASMDGGVPLDAAAGVGGGGA